MKLKKNLISGIEMLGTFFNHVHFFSIFGFCLTNRGWYFVKLGFAFLTLGKLVKLCLWRIYPQKMVTSLETAYNLQIL